MIQLLPKILHRKHDGIITDYSYIEIQVIPTFLRIDYRGFLDEDYQKYIISVFRDYFKDSSADLKIQLFLRKESITSSVIIRLDLPF